MLIRLLRVSSAGADGGAQKVFSDALLQVERLTIGSDAGCELQLPLPDVAARHAVIRARGTALVIEALRRARLRVNGRRRARAVLREGDTVEISSATVRVREADPRATVLLEICEASTRRSARLTLHQALSLRAAGLSVRTWAWGLVLAVLAILLLPQLAASFHPVVKSIVDSGQWSGGIKAWQPGPLHASHKFIEKCDSCHTAPLVRVQDEQCVQCHASTQHHVDERSGTRPLFAGMRCGSCHVEHLEDAGLVPRDPRLCTDCHADLHARAPGTPLQDVADFTRGHPDIAARLPPVENSHLQFSHAVHLNPKGIKAEDGYETLGCPSCHEPNASGRQMLPIRMERHCARCHSLQFDEHDPRTTVPHGSVAAVFEALQAHFIREYLAAPASAAGTTASARRPGGEAEVMSKDEQRRARDWAERQSRRVGDELIGTRVCVQCHEVSHEGEEWTVVKVRLEDTWMPGARFDHAAHKTSECTTCHSNAPKSRTSHDVLMPHIETCRTCHGGPSEARHVDSDCEMCHRFHRPGRGRFDAPARAHD